MLKNNCTWPFILINDRNDFPLACYQAINHSLIELGFFNLSRKTVNQFEGQGWKVHGNFTWQTKMKYIRARCFETFRKDKKCYMLRLYTLMNMSIFILSFLFSQQEWTVSEVNTVFFYVHWFFFERHTGHNNTIFIYVY